ncbi:hypothetical protein AFCA_008656 [Aspergillus flavus]|uniref:Asp-hemolysin n=1 Tax=Aspergillus flavus TaxID=5059 RepID=A0AB74CQZ2_ASPFL|nr:Asp-hemolysin precursor [Aspergillus flavus]RMZ48341.1 Asp-hemolysin precursor [Aspergillus flavus]UDD61277.1 hypothetical protein AFCA_008656 [Aspergillus flavus]
MYNQWIGFNIVNNSGSFIKISNAYLSVGKFYRWDDKDNEISSDSVINTRILPGVQDLSFGSCGRSDAPVGTEGEISFEADGKVVAKVVWDCPAPAGSWNIVKSFSEADGFGISHNGDGSTGAIGLVTFEISNT